MKTETAKRASIKFLLPVLLSVFLLMPSAVLAAGFSLSPARVEFDVPAHGSAVQKFVVYNFKGDLEISLEDIPLRVEPKTVPVDAGKEGVIIELTFYGDESLGSQDFEGKIRFRGKISSLVNIGYKVKAKIHQIAPAQTSPQKDSRLTAMLIIGAVIVALIIAVIVIAMHKRRGYYR